MNTSRTFKTTLHAACAAVSLGSGAHADVNLIASTPTWVTAYSTAPDGTAESCFIRTQSPNLHWFLLIGAHAGNAKLQLRLASDLLPAKTIGRTMSMQVDGYQQWTAVGDQVVIEDHAMSMTIGIANGREFVHEITAGTTMHVAFGNGSTWDVSLTGTTPSWEAMMPCLKTMAPAVVASLTTPGTTPAAAPVSPAFTPPAAPFGSTAFAPPAAAPPAARLDTTEVGLITHGGVKHVRGLAGSGSAIMFVLDSGAADVQITRKAALDLALAGELVATGRTTTFVTATGATNVQPVYLLRSLTVGERTVTNVECNVTDDGDPLLGQSFLGRLTSWSIDNAKQTLVLGAAV